jgi:hypothetical protein
MRRALVGAAMAAAMVGLGVAAPAHAAPKQGMPVAAFEWEMAERTRSIVNYDFKPGVDVAHNMIEGPAGKPGLYGGVSSVPLDEINPKGGFEVALDACASTGRITQYEWRVDGKRVSKGKDCSLTTRLTQEPHEVELTVNGGGRKTSTTQIVTPNDILVVSMGDSYSSGEGNPTEYTKGVPDSTLAEAKANNGSGRSEGGLWDHANCHRSTRSGQANAAIDLEQDDPHSSVTFIYVACSGAQIDSGILGIKNGNLGGHEQPQAKQAYDLTIGNGRAIDAVMLGIGGNDIGFVPIVAECALQQDCFLSTEGLPVVVPDVPVTDKKTPLNKSDLEDGKLLLKPNDEFPDLNPGPPFRALEAETLHSCDGTFQSALRGDGGIGPDDTCRESIGTSPAGLAQVAQCLNGDGDQDCTSVPSYYQFPDGGYQHPGGDTWPGLAVAENRVFYTEYPDLTTKFDKPIQEKDLQYCSIALNKTQMIALLEAAKGYVDDPDLIDDLISALEASALENFGLTKNEFQYAAEAVLGGKGVAGVDKVLEADLTSLWKVRTGPGLSGKETIGPDALNPDLDLDFLSIGKDSPALNEVTALSEGDYGWMPVTGTFEEMSGHGLCAGLPGNLGGEPWAYLIGSAQGTNISGSAHPNLPGMETYHEPLSKSLIGSLLP